MGVLKRASSAGVLILVLGVAQRAVAKRKRSMRRARLHRAYAEAARDPQFMEDMGEVDHAFDVAAGDGLEESGLAEVGRR